MWKKKLREYKGKFQNYSIRKKLNNQKKINSNFETILNSLTLEDIIALKLELAASHVNHKLYGFPFLRSLKYLVRESVLIQGSYEVKIDALLSMMTLDEKIGQTVMYSSGMDITGPVLDKSLYSSR